jgi:hypothetical protein
MDSLEAVDVVIYQIAVSATQLNQAHSSEILGVLKLRDWQIEIDLPLIKWKRSRQ